MLIKIKVFIDMNEQTKLVLTSPNVVCPKCGNRFFKEVYALKRISAIISPTGEEELFPIPVYACDKCGTIPDEVQKKRNFKVFTGEDNAVDTSEEPEKKDTPSIILP